jgi:hypothetical protein
MQAEVAQLRGRGTGLVASRGADDQARGYAMLANAQRLDALVSGIRVSITLPAEQMGAPQQVRAQEAVMLLAGLRGVAQTTPNADARDATVTIHDRVKSLVAAATTGGASAGKNGRPGKTAASRTRRHEGAPQQRENAQRPAAVGPKA